MKTEFKAISVDFGDHINVAIIQKNADGGRVAFGRPVTMEPMEELGYVKEPTFQLDPLQAKQLMDELWRCGIRPTEADSPGELGATKRHLEDMRTLVFEKEKPGE
jgi:hypothetical protein